MPVWTMGMVVGLPISIVAVSLLATIGFMMIHAQKQSGVVKAVNSVVATSCIIAAIAGLGAIAMFTYPWDIEYHQYRPVIGKTDSTDSRFTDGGKQRFVFVIDGQKYAVDDYRAAVIRPGDTVSLLCIKEWQWVGTPKNICYWNE